jgi:uncharacterized OsmC-like protein
MYAYKSAYPQPQQAISEAARMAAHQHLDREDTDAFLQAAAACGAADVKNAAAKEALNAAKAQQEAARMRWAHTQ